MDFKWVQKIISRINLDWIFKKSRKIDAKDTKKALSNLSKIYDKTKDDKNFKDIISQIKSVVPMVKDYYKGNYKEVPFLTISSIVFALLYTLSPFDFIPDLLPVIGLTDDATVWVFVLQFVNADLNKYTEWKSRNQISV